MNHFDTIQEKIKPIVDTDKFINFILYLLSDLKYGAINNKCSQKSKESIQSVIDIYKDWLDSGKKPELDRWIEVRDKVVDSNTADWAANAGFVTSSHTSVAYLSHNTSHNYGIDEITISEAKEAHIIKLDSLINEDGLYSWEDYEKD